MNGLAFLHLELTSRCNKSCWMCGRRKLEKDYPELCNWGDMPKEMVYEISKQVPIGIVIQFHNNGEPLLYPDLGWALSLFRRNIRCFNTNGKLLLGKADEIIGNLETLTISVVQDDPEGDEQYEIVSRFLEKKGERKPRLIYRLLGRVDQSERWKILSGLVASRVLHSPEGSRDYERSVTIPEIGICLDLLTHLAINRFGDISICVRFDPERKGVIENFSKCNLREAWYSNIRQEWIRCHIEGRRDLVPLCKTCEYWGVPRGE